MTARKSFSSSSPRREAQNNQYPYNTPLYLMLISEMTYLHAAAGFLPKVRGELLADIALWRGHCYQGMYPLPRPPCPLYGEGET
jgi:hypothetical protein